MTPQRRFWLAGTLVAALAAVVVALVVWAPWGGQEPSKALSRETLDGAGLKESVQVGVTPAPREPGPAGAGGRVERGTVSDSVEIIIRDASGKVKESKPVGGQ